VSDDGGNRVAVPKRKLIEVALHLEAINRESAREQSIRHGHPPRCICGGRDGHAAHASDLS